MLGAPTITQNSEPHIQPDEISSGELAFGNVILIFSRTDLLFDSAHQGKKAGLGAGLLAAKQRRKPNAKTTRRRQPASGQPAASQDGRRSFLSLDMLLRGNDNCKAFRA